MVHMDIFRNIYSGLVAEMSEPEFLILLGPRQVGKSTLLEALKNEAQGSCLFLDLEQATDLEKMNKSKAELINWFLNFDYVFIDEFYYQKNASSLFKAVFDRKKREGIKTKIVASGSSSIEIHTHLKESLAGRYIRKMVYPLTLDEYRNPNSKKRIKLDEFLIFGGLPGLSMTSNAEKKKEILLSFVSSYLFKDIKALIREENIKAFNHLLYILATHQGQIIEVSSLAKEVGLTFNTMNRYLEILEQTYVNFTISSYHTNLANELKKSRKTYLFDLGVRNCLLKDYREVNNRPDKGQVWESFVFQHLMPKITPECELRFWRTKHKYEVDFVLVKNREPIPIEVKSSWDPPNIPKGVKAFCGKYPNTKDVYIVSNTSSSVVIKDSINFHFVSFLDFPYINF